VEKKATELGFKVAPTARYRYREVKVKENETSCTRGVPQGSKNKKKKKEWGRPQIMNGDSGGNEEMRVPTQPSP